MKRIFVNFGDVTEVVLIKIQTVALTKTNQRDRQYPGEKLPTVTRRGSQDSELGKVCCSMKTAGSEKRNPRLKAPAGKPTTDFCKLASFHLGICI